MIKMSNEITSVQDIDEFLSRYHPMPKDKFDTYISVKETILGSGTQAEIRLGVIKQTNKKVALKYFRKKSLLEIPKSIYQLGQEINALSSSHHPNIIGYYGFCIQENYIVLILEYADRGDLLEYVNKNNLSEETVATLFTDMMRAIEYLHLRGIIHRDIKLENFLITSTRNHGEENICIKLADFGFCKNQTTHLNTPCGSLTYAAPEVFRSEDYDISCDIWSMGICLFCMLTKKSPYGSKNERDIRSSVINKTITFAQMPPFTSKDAINLFENLCVIDPNKRLSAHEALYHPFLSPFKLAPTFTPSPIPRRNSLAPPPPSPSSQSSRQASDNEIVLPQLKTHRFLGDKTRSLSLSARRLSALVRYSTEEEY